VPSQFLDCVGRNRVTFSALYLEFEPSLAPAMDLPASVSIFRRLSKEDGAEPLDLDSMPEIGSINTPS
jgi:hypothetical protein